jgi:hypothetical protein
MTKYADVYNPIKDGDYQINVSTIHGDIDFNSLNFSGSGVHVQTGLYSRNIPLIGDARAANDPTNSFDGSLQSLAWYRINQQYYKFPYDPTKTFEHPSRKTEKFLYYSSSIFAVPYALTGEQIKPTSVRITTPTYTLQDDGYGNLRDIAYNTASFAPADNLVAYWGFNDQYKFIKNNFGLSSRNIAWSSKVYFPEQQSIAKNINYQPGVELNNNNTYTASGIAATFNGLGYIETQFDTEKFKYTKTDDFAISLWIKAPTSQSNTDTITNSIMNIRGTTRTEELLVGVGILSSSNKPVPANAYAWDINIYNQTAGTDSGKLLIRRSDGTFTTHVTSSTHVTASIHNHVLYQKSGSVLQLYVNGVLESTQSDNLSVNPINYSNLFIGSLNNTLREAYSGSIDEIRIYNKSLNSSQISSLANRSYVTASLYQTNVAGNIFYRRGIVVVSSVLPKYDTLLSDTWHMHALSTYKVIENEVLVRIPKDIFNHSFNPTLLKSPYSDELIDEITTGSLTPYITTIGLYNDAGELLVVARLGTPLQKRTDIDTNVIIKWDS